MTIGRFIIGRASKRTPVIELALEEREKDVLSVSVNGDTSEYWMLQKTLGISILKAYVKTYTL